MKMQIIAIGKARTSPETEIFDTYKIRTPWEVTIKELEVKKDLPENSRKSKESELLLGAVPPGSFIIALDERGKIISSEEFSGIISDLQNQGKSNISFLIGGASGHSKELLERADFKLSFGKMTWPHMMVRPMLMEQIYRAHTILQNHPYHK